MILYINFILLVTAFFKALELDLEPLLKVITNG